MLNQFNNLNGFGSKRRGSGGAPTGFASYVFNGTDEALTRDLATVSPGTLRFTYSLWLKHNSFSGEAVWQTIDSLNQNYVDLFITSEEIQIEEIVFPNLIWSEVADGITNADARWDHWVVRYESSNATADDRIRLYKNGTLLTDADVLAGSNGGKPSLNEAHGLFRNGSQHQIGAWLDVGTYFQGKMAFIDCVDGTSAAPTDFAFNNGGIWSRIPYAGSHGTYGFSLDGTSFNDVSSNAFAFTPVNMDSSNLDTNDLPPYTSEA